MTGATIESSECTCDLCVGQRAQNEALIAANAELRARNLALHKECHALRMRLNYPLAVTEDETKAALR